MPKFEVPEQKESTFQSIVDAIDTTEAGDPDRQLSTHIEAALKDAIRAAQGSGQNAAVTVKITVKPGVERRVEFAAAVTTKIPRPPLSAATLYADAKGVLHHSDPAQGRLPLQMVPPKSTSKE